jgi:thiol-disulfide isomerase/thioredoxin
MAGPAVAQGPRYPSDRIVKLIALVATPILVIFVVLAVVATRRATSGRFPTATLSFVPAGVRAADFSLPRLGGGAPVRLAAERGEPTIVNFFASWCPNCRAELNAFGAVSRRDAGKVHFLGVDANDTNPRLALQLLASARIDYPVGIDATGAVSSRDFDVADLPETFLIGAHGRVIGEVFGAQTTASLERWVAVATSARFASR